MKTYFTKKEREDYDKLCIERIHGHLLNLDGIRFICESYNYDPEKIGKHFLELLPYYDSIKKR
jgi:hypothetical protein